MSNLSIHDTHEYKHIGYINRVHNAWLRLGSNHYGGCNHRSHKMRSKQFYVSNDVSHAFWLLAKAKAASAGVGVSKITPDELVDDVLRKYLEDNYPRLFAYQKSVDALEKKLIEEIQTK